MSDGYLSLSQWVSLSLRCSGSSCTSPDVHLSPLKWPETACVHMAPGKVSYPTVYVVDSQMKPPPLPPKPARRQRKDVIQTLLMILVCVALCGMAVEACFIYHLFTSKENHVSSIRINFLKHPCLVYFHSSSFLHSYYLSRYHHRISVYLLFIRFLIISLMFCGLLFLFYTRNIDYVIRMLTRCGLSLSVT